MKMEAAYTAGIFKFAFAALVIALAFTATYILSAEAFSEHDLRTILLLGAAVTGALLLPAALLSLRFRVIANAVLSLVTLAGVATANIVHTDLYLTGGVVVLVLVCAGAYAALFVAFRVIDDLRWGGAALSAAALGLVVVAWWLTTLANDPVEPDRTNFQDISFRETPNLYFLSFDSMAPKALINKYMGIETTEFHELFEASFRPFPNFFVNAITTTNSINSVMALDIDVLRDQMSQMRWRRDTLRLFPGNHPSALTDILRKNGYETTSVYSSDWWGKRKGPYIDNYVTFRKIRKSIVCDLLDAKIQDIAFWGYCRFFSETTKGAPTKGTHRLTAERIVEVSGNEGPQFVIASIYLPGHTDRSFQYSDTDQLMEFRDFYIGGSEAASRLLKIILEGLRANDPSGILFVFGDHGPLLSREVNLEHGGREPEEGLEFVIQDTRGVLGGIYPRDACASYFDEALPQRYVTALDATHALLRCLSGGESALINPNPKGRNRIVGWGGSDPISNSASLDYKEFLYE